MQNEYRRPAGENADGAPTVRNILPWRDMEKKVAMRLAAKAAAGELDGFDKNNKEPGSGDIEKAPDSGVRSSVNEPVLPDDGAPLSFQVYTVADLDKHVSARPPRMSMAFAQAYEPPPEPASARELWTATKGIFAALFSFVHAHVHRVKPRPRLRSLLEPAVATWRAQLKKTLAVLPWKKIAITMGIAFGTLLVLLFIVLTAAELTDDLKPAKTTSTSAVTSSDSKEAPSQGGVIEIDEEPQEQAQDQAQPAQQPAAAAAEKPAPKAKAAKPRPKAGAAPTGKKKSEVFVP